MTKFKERQSDNATANALRRFVEQGSDLARPMAIDFFIAVPSEASGRAVARSARQRGFETQVEQDPETGAWTCYCTMTFIPQYETVIAIERDLDAIARSHGGYVDGFGSYGNKDTP